MENLSLSDLATGSPASQYPPSYHSRWDRDSEKDGKEPVEGIRPIQFLKTRATTFSSLTGKEVKDKYGKTKRWITRSGTGLTEARDESASADSNFLRKRFNGWRGGVLASVVSAGSVLLVNLVFTIWAAAKSQSGINIGVIWEENCSTVRQADLWIHIVVNILGTVLLGSSNYTMQCLSSPTRRDVDIAHSKGQYLDIGLPSFRNLKGWRKKCLFGLLVASTIPLHFLWNSAVFTTTQKLDYQVLVVTPDFFNHPAVDCTQNVTLSYEQATNFYNAYSIYTPDYERTPLEFNSLPGANISSSNYWYQADACSTANALLTNATQGKLQRLTNEQCIQEYGAGDGAMKDRGNLLVVTKERPSFSNATILLNFRFETFVSNFTGNNWVCNPTMLNANGYSCDYKSLAQASTTTDWTLGDFVPDPANPYHFADNDQWPIDYCLSQQTDLGGTCLLQYSLIIMICVLIANSIKFGVIFFFLRTSFEPILATIGDGISTFLERPDTTTIDRPFLDRKEARNFNPNSKTTPVVWQPPRKPLRWWHAPSLPRWTITLTLCTAAISTVIGLLVTGNQTVIDSGTSNPYSLGFGNYYEAAVLSIFSNESLTSDDFTSNSLLIAMVAVANIPQVLVSCLYFAYNTVYTSMVSADEWSRFSVHRKSLRTTDPVGLQRSTYWLSLPWTYALPLASASSVLHWLISQSLFVARTEVLNTEGQPEPISYMEVGYSPLGILLSLLFGITMVVVMVVNGMRRLKGGVLVGNNSLAIAAACQRMEKDWEAFKKPVKWGVVRGEGGVGHCCFSSGEVEELVPGRLYI